MHGGILDLPDVDRRVESRSITQPSGSMHLTQRVRHTRQTVRVVQPRPGVRNCPHHRGERREAVQREQHIVHDYEVAERRVLADDPWLPIPISVVRVEREDRDDVDRCEGKRDLRLEGEVVEFLVDAERRADGVLGERWWDRGGKRVGDQLECRRPGKVDGGLILGHACGVERGEHASVAFTVLGVAGGSKKLLMPRRDSEGHRIVEIIAGRRGVWRHKTSGRW